MRLYISCEGENVCDFKIIFKAAPCLTGSSFLAFAALLKVCQGFSVLYRKRSFTRKRCNITCVLAFETPFEGINILCMQFKYVSVATDPPSTIKYRMNLWFNTFYGFICEIDFYFFFGENLLLLVNSNQMTWTETANFNQNPTCLSAALHSGDGCTSCS